MKLVFPLKPKGKFVWEKVFQTFNVKTTSWGLETLAHIGRKMVYHTDRYKKNYRYRIPLMRLENGNLTVPVEYVNFGCKM